MTQNPPRAKMDTRTMVSIAMLTGIAYIVMLLSKNMPSVYGFLDFDFKDVIICIGGFTFGPFAAAIISILVAFIEMITISTTGPWGFLMNVLATCSFSCTACFIYKKMHSKKGAVIGLACGVVAKRASGRASVPGIILCALSLGLSLFYYITLLGFYEVIRDPVYGRQWTQLFTQILTQSGLSLEQFSRIMAP